MNVLPHCRACLAALALAGNVVLAVTAGSGQATLPPGITASDHGPAIGLLQGDGFDQATMPSRIAVPDHAPGTPPIGKDGPRPVTLPLEIVATTPTRLPRALARSAEGALWAAFQAEEGVMQGAGLARVLPPPVLAVRGPARAGWRSDKVHALLPVADGAVLAPTDHGLHRVEANGKATPLGEDLPWHLLAAAPDGTVWMAGIDADHRLAVGRLDGSRVSIHRAHGRFREVLRLFPQEPSSGAGDHHPTPSTSDPRRNAVPAPATRQSTVETGGLGRESPPAAAYQAPLGLVQRQQPAVQEQPDHAPPPLSPVEEAGSGSSPGTSHAPQTASLVASGLVATPLVATALVVTSEGIYEAGPTGLKALPLKKTPLFLPPSRDVERRMPPVWLYDAAQTPDGSLFLIGAHKTLVRRCGRRFETVGAGHFSELCAGLGDQELLAADFDGRLWRWDGRRLACVDRGRDRRHLRHLTLDDRGSLWAEEDMSNGRPHAIVRYDPPYTDGPHARASLGLFPGLLSPGVLALLGDDQGGCFLSTNEGICRVPADVSGPRPLPPLPVSLSPAPPHSSPAPAPTSHAAPSVPERPEGSSSAAGSAPLPVFPHPLPPSAEPPLQEAPLTTPDGRHPAGMNPELPIGSHEWLGKSPVSRTAKGPSAGPIPPVPGGPAMPHHIIRSIPMAHCARGPETCPKCRVLAAAGPRPCLLDIAPPDQGMVTRRVIECMVDGVKVWREFDIVRTFADETEARAYAAEHGITDVELTP